MSIRKVLKKVHYRFKRLLKNEKGSILPMIAVILTLTIILGAVNFALVVMYRDRAVVRNALDAGVASSLAAVAVEKHRGIMYGERLETDVEVWIECVDIEIEEVGTDEDGEPIYEYYEYDNSDYAPRIQTWRNTEIDIKNYIQLNVGQASSVAQQYFKENMEGNLLDVNIVDWNYSVTYDDKRIYTVKKNRRIVPIRPAFVPGREPSGENCDFGSPDIYNEVTNPEPWWAWEFAGANTGSWSQKPDWTEEISEEREIIFPRWVEVSASVTVELPVPFASLVGKDTYMVTFDIVAFKELVHAIP